MPSSVAPNPTAGTCLRPILLPPAHVSCQQGGGRRASKETWAKADSLGSFPRGDRGRKAAEGTIISQQRWQRGAFFPIPRKAIAKLKVKSYLETHPLINSACLPMAHLLLSLMKAEEHNPLRETPCEGEGPEKVCEVCAGACGATDLLLFMPEKAYGPESTGCTAWVLETISYHRKHSPLENPSGALPYPSVYCKKIQCHLW